MNQPAQETIADAALKLCEAAQLVLKLRPYPPHSFEFKDAGDQLLHRVHKMNAAVAVEHERMRGEVATLSAAAERIRKLEADAAEWENVANDGRFADASPEVLARAVCECAHAVMIATLPLIQLGVTRQEAKDHPSVASAVAVYDAAYAEVLKRLKEHAALIRKDA